MMSISNSIYQEDYAMKIISVAFNNLNVFKDGQVHIDLYATDRVIGEKNTFQLSNNIHTQNSIAFVGINATGKTTLLRLLSMAFSIVIQHQNLNEFQSNFIKDGTIMTVVFFCKNKFYKLESTIGCRNDIENINIDKYFYYKEELLFSKNKSSVKTKKDLLYFTDGHIVKKRSTMDHFAQSVLQEDDSIVISVTRDSKIPVIDNINHTNFNIPRISGSIPSEILNVFDENIEYLNGGAKENSLSWSLKFKNHQDVFEINNPLDLCVFLSSGTIKGQNTILRTIQALRSGGYFFVDELENHFNKELVRVILELFNNKKTNPHGACIIFSTHYSEILDFFDRKDNIFICRKANGIIEVFKYADKALRNDIKKSEVIISNALKGTAPQYENITNLRKAICDILH